MFKIGWYFLFSKKDEMFEIERTDCKKIKVEKEIPFIDAGVS